MKSAPPLVLGDARVLEYASIDNTVQYTGRLELYVGDQRMGPVPHLAICQDLNDDELLLVHCDDAWQVLGVQAWNGPAASAVTSVEDVKRRAEEFYRGISSKWIALGASLEAAKAYYSKIQKSSTCSFCGKQPEEGFFVRGARANICGDCVRSLHADLSKLEAEK